MSRIITFYSYKGGVGRSMALANIAVLLARRKLRLLAVDWDLEAPGLERYFSALEIESSGDGLLPLLRSVSKKHFPDYSKYLWKIRDVEAGVEFSFLSSGRESDSNYTKNLDDFDWKIFFSTNSGGDFIESLRNQWLNDFDVVLIDSRTGLTDSGGVCTIQLPDIVIPMFTANYQSLYGVRDVMRLAQSGRQSLAYDRMPLTIFPLPSRFGVRAEYEESRQWIDRFEESLSEFFHDWLPKWARPRIVLERVKIPQIDYFGFGEKLAVIEQGVNDPESMGYVYDYIADLLAADFDNIEKWLGEKAREQSRYEKREKSEITSDISSSPSFNYEFDIFISYEHSALMTDWVREFVNTLSEFTSSYMGEKLRVFFDVTELQAAEAFAERIQTALSRSKLLLIFATPRYFSNSWNLAEWKTFQKRSEIANAELIVPVVLRGGSEFPEEFRRIQHMDMRKFSFSTSMNRRSNELFHFQKKIDELAVDVAKLLKKVPQYDPEWPLVHPDSAELKIVNSKSFPRL